MTTSILKNLLTTIPAVVLLALGPGCTTTKQTEDLLSQAGFKAQPATTPEQRAHLKSLPAHQVTSVERNGKRYFVYPDVAHDVLYIGQGAQYKEYQKLRRQRQLAEEQIVPAEQMEVNWAVWGGW